MSQQYPGQQPYPPQQPGQTPAWGHQQYPGHPAPYGPPPPKKGMSTGAIVGIVLGSIFGVIVLLVILGALVSSIGTDDKSGATSVQPSASKAPARAKEKQPPAKPAEQAPVKVTAKPAKFAPSILHDGGAYTSVTVTIANNGDEKIDVNPLYFTITDTNGSKHTAELAVDKNQIDTVDLMPGENITGVITGKGDFTPKYVTYTDGMFGEGVRGNVS
ncbi:DUF4352 domain-containing protein [Streptomyces sp. NRRL B-24720]|uniref:DUF4352 domain-containing protein n=1 Tax=Streptomyces sp. NRRL B-24720 TaxID=1476876 RepID=UPI0004C58AB6|nr:DUF4352 domain-containing protein [Streptomyces sp. NRRL B-24720]